MTDPAGEWDFGSLRESAAPLARPEAPAGTMLGRYRLVRELASGAVGIVYEAEDTQLRRPVAVKVLREALGSSPGVRHRFEREARAAASLSHPNVLQVYDAGEADGRHYLAMELVDGRSLQEVMESGGTETRPLLELLARAARGLAAAHEKGIVHRDVKPANIMVTAAGEPKVADFGLAHLLDSETALTKSGTPMGTPRYMAPEQVRGDTDRIGPATDVHALGAILYEMLAGRPAHPGGNTAELYGHILHHDPVPPRQVRSKVDADVETICLKALEGEPSARYATAREFADDLERYLRGESILARPPGAWGRILKWTRRHRLAASSALLTLLFAAALAVVAGVGSSRRAAQLRSVLERAGQLESAGKPEEARGAYQAALDLDPADAAARAGLDRTEAGIHRRMKDQVDALQMLEVGRAALDRAFRLFYRADVASAEIERKVDAASQLIQEAVAKAPGLAVGHSLMGRAWEMKGEEEKAEACWREAIRLDAGFAPAHFQLGRLLAFQAFIETFRGRPGVSALRSLNAKRLGEAAASELRAALQEQGADRGLDNEQQRDVALGILAYAEHRSDDALKIAGEGIRRDPRADGVEELFWLLGLLSPPAEQLKAWDKAISIRPRFPWALFCRGLRANDDGDPRGADLALTASLKCQPRFAYGFMYRGLARSQTGQLDEAIADFREALRLKPDYSDAYLGLGVVHNILKDLDAAEGDYSEAIRLEPTLVMAWEYRSRTRLEKGRVAEALADAEEAVRLDPTFVLAQTARGRALAAKGDAAAAAAAFDEAVRVGPNDPKAYESRGLYRVRSGDAEGARKDLEHSLEIAPPRWPDRPAVEGVLERLGKTSDY